MLDNGKIYLRALEPTDIDIVYRWENDSDMWRFGSTTAPFSRHQVWEYLQSYTADIFAQRQLRLMICLKGTDEAVGMIDLFDFDPSNRRASLGLLVDRGHQHKGIGRMSLSLLAGYARKVLRLHQLCVVIAADNVPSRHLFEKFGFSISGTLRDWLLADDGYVDALQMQLILD